MHEIFLDVATRFPDRPAIRTESSEITYSELDRRANQLANFLIGQGVNIGDRVGLLLDRSPELIIAQLAILKAGAVYAPLDPVAPSERLAFFIRDAALSFVFSTRNVETGISLPGLRLLRLEEESTTIAQASVQCPNRTSQGSDPAYVMYTSGSTGTPKGVEIPHRAIVRLVLGQDYFPAGSDQCTLLLGSPAFDGTTYEIWSALLHGACCAVFPDRWIDHQRLEHVIRSLSATCLSISTGLFNQIIDRHPRLLETARHVMIVGEALSVPHVRRAMETMPHVQFGNGYGPTECTTFACAWVIGDPSTWGCESVPLGFPLNNTECQIVDDDLRPTPIGAVGELLLGGDGLALRYLNRPDLTAERFIPHPFSRVPGARLYRTGDRCSWLPNGMIAYVGRNDDQVKLRGYRIELGEVEAGLRRCAEIENAAVLVQVFPSGARGLVACVVTAAGHTWDEDSLLTELALHLPEAMLPNRFFPVEKLPLTPSGKVDRKALGVVVAQAFAREKSASTSSLTSASAPPKIATQLLTIWKHVLKDAELHIDSDFFRSGGDSLLAVELAAEIAGRLERKIPPGVIHRFSSPRSLAVWWKDSLPTESHAIDENASLLIGEGPETPVFYLPGTDGYGVAPKPLAEALQDRHPYFDRFIFPKVGSAEHPDLSVETIARSLLSQVRRVRPHGPYILIGFSFGGLLAYELARLLSEAGETVEHVILWDAYPLLGMQRRSGWGAVFQVLRLSLSPGSWRDRPWWRQRFHGFVRRLNAVKERALGHVTNDPVRKSTPVTSAVAAAEAFRPRPYSGPVSVLACVKENVPWVFERYLIDREAWAKVISPDRLRTFEFPCGHMDCLQEPFLSAFTAKTLEVIGASSENQGGRLQTAPPINSRS